MNESEIRQALAHVDEKGPTWKAVMAVLEEFRQNEEGAALQADMPDHSRQFQTGRLAASTEVATRLEELRQDSVKENQGG